MKRPALVGTIAAVVVLGGALAWIANRRGGGSLRAGPAKLAVEWRGKVRGRMVLPAQINWCPVTRVAVLEAVSGDSGVAIVWYEQNALTAGVHPVFSPEAAASAPRPSATAAMRWMRLERDTALAGFRAVSGAAQIRLVPGKASGDLNVRMRSVSGQDSVTVRGVFRDVPVVSTAIGCGS
ncbi:MAG TPA: hypothetical protein VID74_07255 [Gemmatimonadales bacterium]|jgi:hypothetical protein